jgi:hypothetical protein
VSPISPHGAQPNSHKTYMYEVKNKRVTPTNNGNESAQNRAARMIMQDQLAKTNHRMSDNFG